MESIDLSSDENRSIVLSYNSGETASDVRQIPPKLEPLSLSI